MMIKYETANMMLDFAAYIYAQLTKGQASEDEVREFATDAFTSFCEFEDIDEVEEEEDYDFLDDVDEIGYNPYLGGYD